MAAISKSSVMAKLKKKVEDHQSPWKKKEWEKAVAEYERVKKLTPQLIVSLFIGNG